MTTDPRTLPRPEAGSWLDKSARRVEELLSERYGLVSLDPNAGYLIYAAKISQVRAALADHMGLSDSSAQRYIDEKTLSEMAADIASGFSDEKPGTDPFGDTDVVDVPLAIWARMALSLQLTVQAMHSKNPEYALSILVVASSMTTIIAAEAEHGRAGATLRAPRAGTTYVARMAKGASEELAQVGDERPGGVPIGALVAGLRSDAAVLRECL